MRKKATKAKGPAIVKVAVPKPEKNAFLNNRKAARALMQKIQKAQAPKVQDRLALHLHDKPYSKLANKSAKAKEAAAKGKKPDRELPERDNRGKFVAPDEAGANKKKGNLR